jgi:hypothetical protein
LIREKVKQGNGLFIPHEEMKAGRSPDGWHAGDSRASFPSRQATLFERKRILDFLGTLPVALESDTLRVVHAAWAQDAVEEARQSESLESFFESEVAGVPTVPIHGAPSFAEMEDPHVMVKFHEGLAQHMVRMQNSHAAKVLTSGPERPIGPHKKPRYLAGKWRILERSPWWDADQDPRAVVFGHYWRRRPDADLPGKAEVFENVGPWDWMGPHRQAFCVDYSVGYRFIARHHGKNPSSSGALAALRWPERTLVFDDLDESFETQR